MSWGEGQWRGRRGGPTASCSSPSARWLAAGFVPRAPVRVSSDPGALRCRDAHPRRQVRCESFSRANRGQVEASWQAGSGTECVKVDGCKWHYRTASCSGVELGGLVESHRSMCCQIGLSCTMRPCSTWEHSSVAGYCRMHFTEVTEVTEDDTDRTRCGVEGAEVSRCHAMPWGPVRSRTHRRISNMAGKREAQFS